MRAARLIGLTGIASAAALCASSCVAVLGIDDDQQNAVEQFCKCGEVNHFYGSPAQCSAAIGRKLELATKSTRASWLKAFAAKCLECPNWATCYYLQPVCTFGGDPCLDKPGCLDCCAQPSQAPTCADEGA